MWTVSESSLYAQYGYWAYKDVLVLVGDPEYLVIDEQGEQAPPSPPYLLSDIKV